MSNNKASKDNWIKDALRKKYLIVQDDGTIYRCAKADENGVLLSTDYRIVKTRIHKASGRVYFNLTWRGYTKSVLVNRVVAWAFHPNPNNLEQVNHISGDKADNSAKNLEWSSGSENEKHAHRTGLKSGRGSANSNAKLTANDVILIRASEKSAQEIANEYGVGRSTIVNIRSGRTWKHI